MALFLKADGVIPVCFLKAVLNVCFVLNPDCIAAVITLQESSINRRLASSTL